MDRCGSWIAEIYESNSTVVYRVCQRILKDPEDAADATQEVFLRACVSMTAETHAEKARAWLITVARHHCLDVLRRKKRLGKALITLGGEPVWDSEAERSIVDRNFVHAVLSQLRERERQALWQSAVEYRPIGEIGRYFGISYLAAAQLLHRARRHASIVAAKLAAILGLVQLSRLGKRPAVGVELQPLAVALVLPLVVAALVGASSAHKGSARPFAGPGGIAVGAPAKGAVVPSSSTSAVLANEAPRRLGLAGATPPSVVHQVQATVNALVSGGLPAPSQLIPTGLIPIGVPVAPPSGLPPRLPSIKTPQLGL